MKLNAATRAVETEGLGQTSQFRIRENAKMFNVLTSNIYTDKPRAIIREISCNALDAHRMVGQTRPFDIALPSTISPMLVIRDYGPGLSEEDMRELYTTFFDSTKDQSNEAVGAFGLGSKSPFSYTDAFTVTSYFDGMKKTYAAYKTDEGIPDLALVHSEEAEEPTGLEVTVPISPNDFYKFERAAQATLKYFPKNSYKITGTSIAPVQYAMTSDRWALLTDRYSRSKAVMGPVAYDIDFEAAELPTEMREGLELRFELGEVDISPSREQLSMDKTTVSKLRDNFQKFLDEIHASTLDSVAKAPSLWDAAHLFTDTYKRAIGPARTIFPQLAKWKDLAGNETEIDCRQGLKIDWTGLSYGQEIKVIDMNSTALRYKTARYSYSTLTNEKWYNPSDYILIINDLWDTRFERLWGRLQNAKNDLDGKRLLIIKPRNQSEMDEILECLGDPQDYKRLSDLPAPATNSLLQNRNGTVLQNPRVYKNHSGVWRQMSDNRVTGITEGLYVPLKGATPDRSRTKYNYTMANHPWLNGQKIYGFPKRAQDIFDMDEFTKVDDFLQDKREELYDDPDLIEKAQFARVAHHIDLGATTIPWEHVPLIDLYRKTKSPAFNLMAKIIIDAQEAHKELSEDGAYTAISYEIQYVEGGVIAERFEDVFNVFLKLEKEFIKEHPLFSKIVAAFKTQNGLSWYVRETREKLMDPKFLKEIINMEFNQ
jgi:hypothetical protein